MDILHHCVITAIGSILNASEILFSFAPLDDIIGITVNQEEFPIGKDAR
jgi:hypothetical protein